MNSKILMMASSVVLGAAGLFTLFIPHEILGAFNLPMANPLPILIQLIGAVYFAIAMMNWMAKNNAIGGIYARPISIGNFGHFLIGTLILANYQLSNEVNGLILGLLGVYAVFAALFWWLTFRHDGLVKSQ